LRAAFLLAPIQRRSPRILRRRLRAITGTDAGPFLDELAASGLSARVAAAEAEYHTLASAFDPGSLVPSEGAALYAIVRARRPGVVIETGTANGVSTAYLLAALERNAAGRLVSIDLPFRAGEDELLHPLVPGTAIDMYDASPLPLGKDPGWVVPEELRERWELRLGDARELLPALLAEVGDVDVFFHDSLHTREHMLFELETVWPHLRPGGIIVCDDIFQRKHDALPAFARSVGRTFTTFSKLGFVRK